MRTTIKLMIVMAAGLLTFTAVNAQLRQMQLDINYNIGIPAGTFTDYVSNTSFRGWTGNLLYGINENISVGLGVGFQDFYEKFDRDVYKLSDGGDISAVVSNSIQTIPVLALFQYKFMPGMAVQPYVGVGVGGNMIMFNQYLGQFNNSDNTFRFAARPQAGVFIPFRKAGTTGLNIYGSYNFMPYNDRGLDNLNNWGIGAGLKFPLR